MDAYLKFDDPQGSRTEEAGPFGRVVVEPGGYMVNEDDYPAITFDPSTNRWKVVDGEAIGRADLTGETFPVVFGQAK